jgi:thioredoxin-like negative regulator of GroEL
MTLLEFGAAWCQPCKLQEKELAKYKVKHPEVRVQTYQVDQQDGQAMASQYGINMLPAFVVLDAKGNPRGGISGLQSVAQIEKMVQNAT